MPSEKQIEAATEALKHAMSNEPFLEYEDAVRGILTAAEQAEPVPAARSGAVKVGKLAHLVAGMMNDAGQPRPNGDILHDCLERALPSCLEPAEPAKDAEPYLWLHPWNGSTSKYRSDIAARCPKDGPQPIPLYTRPPESRLPDALDRYEAAANHVGGCGDSNCVVVRPVGQRTNGGCRYYTDKMKAQRMMMAGQMLSASVRDALAQEDGR